MIRAYSIINSRFQPMEFDSTKQMLFIGYKLFLKLRSLDSTRLLTVDKEFKALLKSDREYLLIPMKVHNGKYCTYSCSRPDRVKQVERVYTASFRKQ